jgi:hypothetical protein
MKNECAMHKFPNLFVRFTLCVYVCFRGMKYTTGELASHNLCLECVYWTVALRCCLLTKSSRVAVRQAVWLLCHYRVTVCVPACDMRTFCSAVTCRGGGEERIQFQLDECIVNHSRLEVLSGILLWGCHTLRSSTAGHNICDYEDPVFY